MGESSASFSGFPRGYPLNSCLLCPNFQWVATPAAALDQQPADGGERVVAAAARVSSSRLPVS